MCSTYENKHNINIFLIKYTKDRYKANLVIEGKKFWQHNEYMLMFYR